MSKFTKSKIDKDIAIPVCLSRDLDFQEYEDMEIQVDLPTEVLKPEKNYVYTLFRGGYPFAILLKFPKFQNYKILSFALFAIEKYNETFHKSLTVSDAQYFLTDDINNTKVELSLSSFIPTPIGRNMSLIIEIIEKKKQFRFSARARKGHLFYCEMNNDKIPNKESKNQKKEKEKDDNGKFDKKKPSFIKYDSEKEEIDRIMREYQDEEDEDEDEDENDNNIIQDDKNSPNENPGFITADDSQLFDKNTINPANGITIDACSLIAAQNDIEANALIEKGDYFAQIGDPKLASLFYWSAGTRGITSLITLSKLSGELSIIDQTRIQLVSKFPNELNKKLTDKPKIPRTIEEKIKILSNPKKLLLMDNFHSQYNIYYHSKFPAENLVTINYFKQSMAKKSKNAIQNNNKKFFDNKFLDKIQVKEFIKSVSKSQPYIALKICLKYSEYTEFIPIPCRVEEVMDSFVQFCSKNNYDNMTLFYFAEIFAKNGLIPNAMQIGFNISVLSGLPECAIRRACWIMLISQQFANLFLLLETYFKRCQNRSIGPLSAKIIYGHLMTVKKVNNKLKNTQRCLQTIVDPLDPSDLDFLCIVLDAACFLFLNGYIDDFKDILSAINTQNRKYFEKTGIPPEFDFYVYIDRASTFAVNDRVTKESIFAIGDEGTLNNAFNPLFNFEKVIPHPIPRIAIYDLRKGKKNLRKAAFWQQIKDFTNHHQILLVLGHYDLLYTIPKLLQKDHTVMSFTDAVNKIIEVYLYVIEKVRRNLPMKQIFIHPLKFHNKFLENQKNVFNSALENALPNYVVMLSENDCNVFYDNSLLIPWRSAL